ncbi:uncharacterized protein LOC143259211 [Megalopta genalis]|uniref:uncharacterized protein LOC143259211 n=1 Tax=Megalopta genalis TaxID=115081 RepID=UPI003FD1D143
MDKDVRRKCGKVRRALFHLLLIVGGATGLKDLTINVLPMVRSGDTVTLSCDYDLEGVPLYRIQWFLEETEFYRYVPDRVPPYNSFDVAGIHVDVSKSNKNDVTLFNVSRGLTGRYKCEVSAGRPSYHTLIKRAEMEVVDAPKTDPTIEIQKERISVGKVFRAHCTTGNSMPACNITWTLNGKPIANDSMLYSPRYLKIPQADDSVVSKSTIEFKVSSDMFKNGRLHLRCTVNIADVYRKTADIEINEDTPRIASITGESPPRGHRGNSSAGRSTTAWTTAATMILALIASPVFLLSTSMTMFAATVSTSAALNAGSR